MSTNPVKDARKRAVTERQKLEERIARLRRALAHYADEDNWSEDDWGIKAIHSDYGDPWKKAALALKRDEKAFPRG